MQCNSENVTITKITFYASHDAGWLKMPDMNLTDVNLTDQVSSDEMDRHEIGGQDIILFKN